jgi:lysophospholipase L1-like esterase
VLGSRGHPGNPDHDGNGFRNNAIPSEVSIVTLGDSQTYGVGVAREDAWPTQLTLTSGLSVYNMSFSGYGPSQGLSLWPEAVKLHPKVVIQALYSGNDLFDVYQQVYRLGQHPSFRSTGETTRVLADLEKRETLLAAASRANDEETELPSSGVWPTLRGLVVRWSRVVALMRSAWHSVSAPAPQPSSWSDLKRSAAKRAGRQVFELGNFRTILTPARRAFALNFDEPRIAEGYRLSVLSIDRLNDQVRSSGARLVVLLIPTKELVFATYARDGESPLSPTGEWAVELEREGRMWAQAKHDLDERAIPYIDALPALVNSLRNGVQPYPESSDGHPNPIGHREIAKWVRDALRERGLTHVAN